MKTYNLLKAPIIILFIFSTGYGCYTLGIKHGVKKNSIDCTYLITQTHATRLSSLMSFHKMLTLKQPDFVERIMLDEINFTIGLLDIHKSNTNNPFKNYIDATLKKAKEYSRENPISQEDLMQSIKPPTENSMP